MGLEDLFSDESCARVSDVDLWSFIENPVFPSTTYTEVNNDFYFVQYTGLYMFDPSYLADYFDDVDYQVFSFFYDGWAHGLYMKTTYYNWANGRDSEAFGACIGKECGGLWLYSYYNVGTSTSEIDAQAIGFLNLFSDPDASTPDLPYYYRSAYAADGSTNWGFRACGYSDGSLSDILNAYGYVTAWRYVAASDDYANGDEATAWSWSSLASGSNVESTVTLNGTEKSGAFEFVASGAALAIGVAALL